MAKASDAWDSGEAYERYVGRWSRLVARPFIEWLQPRSQASWADVGCGTGALTSTILDMCRPAAVAGVDASAQFIEQARSRVQDARVRFGTGDATGLPWPAAAFDLAVSGLVLNFVPDPETMVREMARVTKPPGTVALYVWDYADGMQMMRAFWDTAAEVHPEGIAFDEAKRFPICHPDALRAVFEKAGLVRVDTTSIEIDTVFADFDDYWIPFLGKSGPAPAYLATLGDATREAVRSRLQARLHTGPGGAIVLRARAWAVRGAVTAGNLR